VELSAVEAAVHVLEISAEKNKHLKPLRNLIFEHLPTGEPLYPPDVLTNIDQRFFFSELIREKVFNTMGDEVPFTTTVEIEEIEDKENVIVIKAVILTTALRYRKMIIGRGGRKIARTRLAAGSHLPSRYQHLSGWA
jgi:GTP-binding protein Era